MRWDGSIAYDRKRLDGMRSRAVILELHLFKAKWQLSWTSFIQSKMAVDGLIDHQAIIRSIISGMVSNGLTRLGDKFDVVRRCTVAMLDVTISM